MRIYQEVRCGGSVVLGRGKLVEMGNKVVVLLINVNLSEQSFRNPCRQPFIYPTSYEAYPSNCSEHFS